MGPRSRPARSLAALLTAGVLLLATGCGSETSPADDVPALATSLDAVDEAVVSGDDKAVRDAVAELTAVTERARDAGDLDAAAADRILAAAEALLAALGEPATPTEEKSSEPPTPAPSMTQPSAPESSSDEDGGDDDAPGQDDEKGKPDKPGKPDGKDDEKDD